MLQHIRVIGKAYKCPLGKWNDYGIATWQVTYQKIDCHLWWLANNGIHNYIPHASNRLVIPTVEI